MKAVSGIVTMALLVMVMTTATVAAASQYPQVSTLHAFSPDANYMSLPGYLRYLVHQQDGHWLRFRETARIVHQERGE